MSINGSSSTFLPFTISGLTDATFSNSNIGNGTATTLQVTTATPSKIARFDANQYLVSAAVDVSDLVPYTGATTTVNLGSQNITTTRVPVGVSDLTNKTYVDSAISASNLLPLNNTWTGTNTFNNTVTMGDTYTTNVNSAFASIQTPIANATNLATGGTDFTGAMPVCVLTKPSYYNLAGAGTLAMSVGLDLGYTGGSFTAGASTTISGSWTANTVSNRIATITFDVSAYIGKSLRCVWEGLTPLVFATSPPPFFTVVNGATTVYSSPQPISGTNTYTWNFTPTVGTTTITYTVQSSGTPSLPAFSWTGFSIKQIGASRLAYKTGAKYTATFTNMLASQNMSFSVYQYTTAGGLPLAISDISNIPITTSGQTITITFSVNIFSSNLGTVVFFFQPSSANQYVRFDSMTLTRADMTVSGNVQSGLTVNSSVVSSNPSGNSGNGSIINMTAFNGSFGSIECFDNVNATSANKLPLALQAYGGSVGIGITNPVANFQVQGGTASICGGTNFANANNYVAPGSLVIGDCVRNYGGGTGGWNSNTAGLLLECLNDTEIAVHDSGTRVASFMYYTNASNTFTIGRAMDSTWGTTKVETRGDLILNAGTGGRFIKYGSDGNYYATFNGGNSSNAPFIEFYAFGARRMYLGNSTSNDNYIWAENGTNIRIGTNGSTRMSFLAGGDIYFENGFREIITVGLNGYGQYRMVQGSYGVMWRQDGSTTYLLITNSGDQYGQWNSLRPFYVDNASGRITMENGLTVKNGDFYIEGLPFLSNIYSYPLVQSGARVGRSQAIFYSVYAAQSIGWGGGVNMTYAFYKYSDSVSVSIRGKLSYWVGGNTRAYPYLRVYSQSTGIYWYFSLEAFTNVGGNHTTFPFEVILPGNGYPYSGWYDCYVYNNGNCNTDTNDQLWLSASILPGSSW